MIAKALGVYAAAVALSVAAAIALTLVFGCTPERPAASVALLAFRGVEPHAICQAFAVRVRGPRVQLLTAAHCLRGAQPGASIAYTTRDQWYHTTRGYSWARVVQVDKGADRARLAPDASDQFAALEISPNVPDSITALSPGWVASPGAVREVVGRYYLSTLDVRPGWSGSPVLDARGRVVGIVIACEAIGGECLPSAGVFVGVQ